MPKLLLVTEEPSLYAELAEALEGTNWSIRWKPGETPEGDQAIVVLDAAHPRAQAWDPGLGTSVLLVVEVPESAAGLIGLCHDFVVRPFSRTELLARLRRLHLRLPEGPKYQYADMFASTAIGIVVVNPEREIVFANPRAYDIVGHRRETIDHDQVRSIVASDDLPRLQDILRGFERDEYPQGIDMKLLRRDGTEIVCSCSFSPMLGAEGHVLVSFQDVTDQRETEQELLKTMEFLESLIDASVDAIVATDMERKIVLFNPSAERISGHHVADVLGTMKLEDLLGQGSSELVMQRLVSAAHGGEGRLEPMTLDLLDVVGNAIPVQLSASLIYERGEPSAIVLIFADLRDRIRVEQRLAEAQKKLAFTEKQAVLAELAGTAAHELNQPLTSMMAYAELLLRKSDPGSSGAKAAEVLIREAERMAEIVRKIAKITRYETTSYVGQQKIFDLDRATDSTEPDGVEEG